MIEFADLRDLPVFEGVSDETLNRVVAHVADVRVDEGQWLVREGESPAFYVLLSGTFDLMKRYPDGMRRLAVREIRAISSASCRSCSARRSSPVPGRGRRCASRASTARSSACSCASPGPSATGSWRPSQDASRDSRTQAAGPLRIPIVIGTAHDAACHGLRDFLSRNQVRFEWADPDEEWIAARADLQDALAVAADCSVVLLPNGRILKSPTPSELAVEVGLQVEPSHDTYDLVIVGGGPAGLAAAVYGASEGLRTLLVEREATGGQAGTSTRIENYLGFPSGVSGDDLAARAASRRCGWEPRSS